MKNYLIPLVGILIVIGCAVTAFVTEIQMEAPLLSTLSNSLYDAWLRRLAVEPRSGRVAIVDIDEASMAEYGQWPWARDLMARITKTLFDAGASVVTFDIVFAERDRTSLSSIRQAYEKRGVQKFEIEGSRAEALEFDQLFSDALGEGQSILGSYIFPFGDSPPGSARHEEASRPPSENRLEPKDAVLRFVPAGSGMTIAIPLLREWANTAFFNTEPDDDSVIRKTPLLWQYGSQIYHSLALEALRLDTIGSAPVTITVDRGEVVGVALKDLYTVPTDYAGRFVCNFRRGHFPTIPIGKVLENQFEEGTFSNKIVFVGTSAIGLKDSRATPLDPEYPGVEVHATVVDNVLAGDVLVDPIRKTLVIELALILLLGLALTLCIHWGKAWVSFLITLLFLGGLYFSGWYCLNARHLVFVPARLMMSILVLYTFLTLLKYWQEERQKKQVRNMFGTMVSSSVLKYMEENPGSFSLSGHRAEATMFFSDIAGFTSISEGLEPARLAELLNRYLSPMTEIIMARNGYVDKYNGDAIMAEWGVPFAMDDHAVQGCLAALEQQNRLAELRPVLKEEFGHEIHVRMGVNSGSVTAGNMGSDLRFQYTVMGDAVNQAARYEPANKDYHTEIMIGDETYQHAKDAIEARLLDLMVVKGKTEPIKVYELLAVKGELAAGRAEMAALYEKALRLHWDRKWDESLACLAQALEKEPNDGPSIMLRERVEAYKANPPPDTWQGEVVRTHK
ncbi:MAG: adenylate/guanylate cyclase domain-containing protein [Kiritimatiellae bacterium]|nr:adenylate/guanylate cyclase domain-containing protein [Kiritimatiellia bacterium]